VALWRSCIREREVAVHRGQRVVAAALFASRASLRARRSLFGADGSSSRVERCAGGACERTEATAALGDALAEPAARQPYRRLVGSALPAPGPHLQRDELPSAPNDAALVATSSLRERGPHDALAAVNGDSRSRCTTARAPRTWVARDRIRREAAVLRAGKTGRGRFASQPEPLLSLPASMRRRIRASSRRFAGSHYRTFDKRPARSRISASRRFCGDDRAARREHDAVLALAFEPERAEDEATLPSATARS